MNCGMVRVNALDAKICCVMRRHEKDADEQDRGAWRR